METRAIELAETQRARRGHPFLPPFEELAAVPGLYETESTPTADKIVWLHYFSAGSDHYITEIGYDGDQLLGFGYTKMAAFPEGAEWGYTDFAELEAVNAHRGLVIVERDLFWTPKRFSQIGA
jgi:hypothetical protein